MVRNDEEPGFTAYDAEEVGFKLEDGKAMFTTEDDVVQPGWHRWKYNVNRGEVSWAKWSDTEFVCRTTIIQWKACERSDFHDVDLAKKRL